MLIVRSILAYVHQKVINDTIKIRSSRKMTNKDIHFGNSTNETKEYGLMEKLTRVIIVALLSILPSIGFAQANTDSEEYKTRVRNTLQLDYSMPDYSTSSINAEVMGERLAMIVKKTLEMCQNQSNLGSLSVIQSRSIDGLPYCTVTNVKFAKASKQGNVITMYFNTNLAENVKKIKKSQLVFQFVDGVSEDVATNDYFLNICRYIKE